MNHTEKMLLVYEIQFVHNSVESLKESPIELLSYNISTLEQKVDTLWKRIEAITELDGGRPGLSKEWTSERKSKRKRIKSAQRREMNENMIGKLRK